MVDRLTAVTPRHIRTAESSEVITSEILADIQRGFLKQPTFFGDQSLTTNHSNFLSGLNASLDFSGWSTALPQATSEDDYFLTEAQDEEIKKMARSIEAYGNVDYDTALDFLYILVSVNKLTHMARIAEAVDLPELNSESMLRNVDAILAVPNLEKVAYMASALAAIIKRFSRYIRASNSPRTSSNPASILSKALGGLNMSSSGSALAGTLLKQDDVENRLGHFLSELVTGTRIPMPIISKNPMVESPSYLGKVFFGESASPMSLMDLEEIFPKKIAAFPRFQNGTGMSSFRFQNFSEFQGTQSLNSIINRLGIGNVTPGNASLTARATEIQEKVRDIIGAGTTDTVEMNRADNAIPVMIGMSAVHTNTDSPIIPSNVFEDGWILSNSLNTFLQGEQNSFLRSLRAIV